MKESLYKFDWASVRLLFLFYASYLFRFCPYISVFILIYYNDLSPLLLSQPNNGDPTFWPSPKHLYIPLEKCIQMYLKKEGSFLLLAQAYSFNIARKLGYENLNKIVILPYLWSKDKNFKIENLAFVLIILNIVDYLQYIQS